MRHSAPKTIIRERYGSAMPPPVVVLTYYNVLGSGGMETHVRRVARQLSALGYAGRVVTPADPAVVSNGRERIGAFRISIVEPATEKWFPWGRLARVPVALARFWVRNFRMMLATVEAVRELGAPLLYVPGPVNLPSTATLNILPFWRALQTFRGTRVVLGARGAASHWYERRAIARLFAIEEAAQIRFADVVTSVDHYYADALFPRKYRSKYRVIPNGVDIGLFAPASTDPGRVVTFVGRLTRDRGIDVFLAAVERLRGADCRFRVVGDGPLRQWFLAKVAAQALPIEWVGGVPHEQMPTVYQASYLVVNPSPVEGIGNITLEAMACGRCVIRAASRYAEFAIRDGVNGMLFPRGDPDGLANRIKEGLSDPDLVGRLGREARATVLQKFSQEVEARAYSELFESLAHGG